MARYYSETPRIMIAAPRSGTGKTTLTCGLLQAMLAKNLRPAAFKCGPDYIDPIFHRQVLGIPSHNLDLFFSTEEQIRGLLAKESAAVDIAILEGVMGFYDGVAGGATASSWHVASATKSPVILVVDPKGMSLSLAALLNGFRNFKSESNICGVILNRCSESLFSFLKPYIESEAGLKALGYLPPLPEASIDSRHLGLSTAIDASDVKSKINLIAAQLERTISFEELLDIASKAPPLEGVWQVDLSEQLQQASPRSSAIDHDRIRIAVAHDAAFWFYYPQNLDILSANGAEIIYFSPLNDSSLPADLDALYLGGGYPEEYAAKLSANSSMLNSVKKAIAQGLPTFAECGGFMYLHSELEGSDGLRYPMVDAIKGQAYKTARLQRFGYATVTANRNTAFCAKGISFPIHEFHYWESSQPGEAFQAKKPLSSRNWQCIVSEGALFAGFPHFYFPAAPELAAGFIAAARNYRNHRQR